MIVSQAIFESLSGNQESMDQNLKTTRNIMLIMWPWPPLQSAYCFCSVLALLTLLSLSCVCLLGKTPEVVELEELKKKHLCENGRIQPNMRIPARHVHAAPE